MPKPRNVCAAQTPRAATLWLVASLLTIALATLAGGIACVWAHLLGPVRVPLRPASGVVLIVAAVVQLRVAAAICLPSQGTGLPAVWRRGAFWKALLVGACVCYGLALLIGPEQGAIWAFLALIALWYSGLLLVCVGDLSSQAGLRRLIGGAWSRRAARAVYLLAVGLVTAEAGARAISFMAGDDWLADVDRPAANFASLSDAPNFGSQSQSSPTTSATAALRVALLGNEAVVGGGKDDGRATLGSLVPGVEVRQFAVPQAGPRHFARQLVDEVARWRPNLVLVLISTADDIQLDQECGDPFDWRSLKLAQLVARWTGTASWLTKPNRVDGMQYIDHGAARLAICRAPMSDSVRRRWTATLAHLDRLAAKCRNQGVPLGLVIVPADFQVNRALCETLRRRSGCKPAELDLELPQRRLAAYAAEQRLPLLDLLPHLRLCEDAPHVRDDGRLSASGTQAAAKALGSWLQSGLLASARPMTAQISHAP